jgi:RNA polymerase sigma-70 factor (ECF subfamily)
MLDGFIQAAQSGDMAALMNTLAADVTLWADSGGKVAGAALRPITGREAVARFVVATSRRTPANARLEVATVNQLPAMIVRAEDGAPFIALTIESDGQQIARIRVIANPDKLTHLDPPARA